MQRGILVTLVIPCECLLPSFYYRNFAFKNSNDVYVESLFSPNGKTMENLGWR